MVVIGVLLLLLGYFLAIHILYVLGLILLVIGVVLFAAGALGHPVAGRSHWL